MSLRVCFVHCRHDADVERPSAPRTITTSEKHLERREQRSTAKILTKENVAYEDGHEGIHQDEVDWRGEGSDAKGRLHDEKRLKSITHSAYSCHELKSAPIPRPIRRSSTS